MEEGYPLNDYYKDHVAEGRTLRKTERTWAALLLIRDPRSHRPFVRFYEWSRRKDGSWARRGVITFYKPSEVRDAIGALESGWQVLSRELATTLHRASGDFKRKKLS